MAKEFGFFNSVNGDRKYLASDITQAFDIAVTTGLQAIPDSFKIEAHEGMEVKMLPGGCMIFGAFCVDNEDEIIELDTADGELDRIDRVVIRFDRFERSIKTAVIKGSPGLNPVAPAPLRNGNQFDLVLADILVKKAVASISGSQITDMRYGDLCGFIGVKGAVTNEEFESHLAESAIDVVHGMGGSISGGGTTGEVTTPHRRQVNTSSNSEASGVRSQVNACNFCKVSGNEAQINASTNSEITANRAQINGCNLCKVDVAYSLVLASNGVLNSDGPSVAGGWHSNATKPESANRRWQLFSATGDIQHEGTIASGHNFTDFAELFPNLTKKKQGYGLLQTIDRHGVRPANDGERVIGVTSATAGIILGDTPFSWQARWLKDEWGAYIMEEVWDEELGHHVETPKENPEWNPELKQVPRKDRPEEWSVVGLVGQIYVRLKEDVEVMDYVKAWQDGVGQKSNEPTNIQVMKITQEYDESKGYKIGFCLFK